MDIMTALATATQAIKLAQDLRGIDKAMDAAEYKLKIADLTDALSNIKLALTDAREELSSKDAEIEKLKKQFRRVADTIEVGGFLYDKKPDDMPKGHAYCPVCMEKHGHMFHLTQSMKPGRLEECPNCKSDFCCESVPRLMRAASQGPTTSCALAAQTEKAVDRLFGVTVPQNFSFAIGF